MRVALSLGAQEKQILSELFLVSAQASGSEASRSGEDGLAIFRIAKEFTLNSLDIETQHIEAEDLARLARFVTSLVARGEAWTESAESLGSLKTFLVSAILQGQAQFSGFESLLRAFGVDQQLSKSAKTTLPALAGPPEVKRKSVARAKREASVGKAARTRVQEVRMRIDERGAEYSSRTTETQWSSHDTNKETLESQTET